MKLNSKGMVMKTTHLLYFIGSVLVSVNAAANTDLIGVMIELENEPAIVSYTQAQQTYATRSPADRQSLSVNAARRTIRINQREQDRILGILRQRASNVIQLYSATKAYNGIAMLATPDQVDEWRQISGVKAVHRIAPKVPQRVAEGVSFMKAPDLWDAVPTNWDGTGISVGIIDTGVDYLHTDLGGPGTGYATNDTTITNDMPLQYPSVKVVGGWDFCGDGYDGHNTPQPDPDPMDCEGHGTSVAGISGGYGTTTNGLTYSGAYGTSLNIQDLRIPPGVAPKCDIYALRVFGCDGSTFLAGEAIEWALDPDGDGDFSDHLDIVNLSLGSEYQVPSDPDYILAENASQAGMILVFSAGNEGDTYFISGARGRTPIVVAASWHNTAWSYGLEVQSPGTITGIYEAVPASFGPAPSSPGITTNIIYADPPLAGTALNNASEVSNRICLIDRGSYDFTVKAINAQNAGAKAVVMVNNVDGPPITMGGSDTNIVIPCVMISKADGDRIKTNLTPGVIAALSDSTTVDRSDYADMIADYSSRGPGLDGSLKPDIAAPTEVMAPSSGTGSEGAGFNGTSASAPHIAGAMALLKQMHPDWPIEDLKALLMNTAVHDIYLAENHGGPVISPSRAGTGRVDLQGAMESDLIARDADNRDLVNLSWGHQTVQSATYSDRSVSIENKGSLPRQVNLSYQSVSDIPGVAYSFPDGTAFTIAAGSSTSCTVRLTLDPALMKHSRADAVTASQDTDDAGILPRYWLSEEAGYLTLTPDSGPTLRLGLYASARPAAAMSCTTNAFIMDAATGTLDLTLTGHDLDTGTPAPSNWVSKTLACELQYIGAEKASLTGTAAQANIYATGIYSDWPAVDLEGGSFTNTTLCFAMACFGPRLAPNSVAFAVQIDADRDDAADFVLYNNSYRVGTDSSDVMGGWLNNLHDSNPHTFTAWLNNTAPTDTPLAVYNSSVQALFVKAGTLGLSTSSGGINYRIISYLGSSKQADQTPWRFYDPANPGLFFNTAPGQMLHDDSNGNNITVYYTSNDYTTASSLGILLLHYHNPPTTQAEIITGPVTPSAPLANGWAGMELPETDIRDRHTALGSDGDHLYITLGNSEDAPFYRLTAGSTNYSGWSRMDNIPIPSTVDDNSGVGDLGYCSNGLYTLARHSDTSGMRCVYRYDTSSDSWEKGTPLSGDGVNAACAPVSHTRIYGGWIGWTRIQYVTDWLAGTKYDAGDLSGSAAHPWDSCITPDGVFFIKHDWTASNEGVLARLPLSGIVGISYRNGMPFNLGMGCAIEYIPGHLFLDEHDRLYILRGGTGSFDGDGSAWTAASTNEQLAIYDMISSNWTTQTLPFAVDNGSEMCLADDMLYIVAANGTENPLKYKRIAPSWSYTGTVHYVALDGSNVSPYTNWTTAAQSIQDAIDQAVDGATILISNGLYNTGGTVLHDALTTRVAVTKAVLVKSVNGPQQTIIAGATPTGNAAVRCVYLTNGAAIEGFTITNGATQTTGDNTYEQSGGGVWCESVDSMVSNCLVTGNQSYRNGAGVYQGKVYASEICHNRSFYRGGGVAYSKVYHSTIRDNWSTDSGGGSFYGILQNCIVYSNLGTLGGGLYYGSAENCTICDNRATTTSGGGSYGGSRTNCIIYYNRSSGTSSNIGSGTTFFCCVAPASGTGSFADAPMFIDRPGGNYRLATNSPCIDAGTNLAWMARAQDYDGHPRMVHDQVDIGAFEAILPDWTTDDGLPLAWLWQYWHSLTGITASADSDGDNFNNLNEYLAGTDPLNAGSYLGIESMQQAGSGFEIEWQSIDGKLYSIRRSTNLVEGFSGLIATNIVGVAPMNTVTDTAPAATGFRLYRVELQ